MKKIGITFIIISCLAYLGYGQINNARMAAEWEESQALLISWRNYDEILTEIVRHAVNECEVIIATTDAAEVSAILDAAGIALTNVSFENVETETLWIRDYGPWTVYEDEVGELKWVDWRYNRFNRPLDDAYSTEMGDILGIEVYELAGNPFEFVHTGGNLLRDGMGSAFSSDLVLAENILVPQQTLNEYMLSYLGVDQYHILPRTPYDQINHLDLHMRLIDEETILIGEYPQGIADGPQIEKNIEWIENHLKTPFGNKYRVIRLPMPADASGAYPHQSGDYRTYTNAVFINKTILVPIYGIPTDDIALQLYQEELPGYKVVGIDCNAIIPQAGALHCITKLVGTEDPLWIAHPRVRLHYTYEGDITIKAIVKHKSGIDKVRLYYRQEGQTNWQEQEMVLVDAAQDLWGYDIPALTEDTTIEYYISALANSGKVQYRPITVPEGWYSCEVKKVSTPPEASFLQSLTHTCVNTAVEFVDNSAGGVQSRNWQFGEEAIEESTPKVEVSFVMPGVYGASLEVENEWGQSSFEEEEAVYIRKGIPPFVEDFESGLHDWQIINPDNNQTWVIQQTPLGYTLRMENFSLQTGGSQRDICQRFLDLRQYENVVMEFDVAYAQRESGSDIFDDGNQDNLQVVITSCEGVRDVVYSNKGAFMATRGLLNTPFTPSDTTMWRTEYADLSAYSGKECFLSFESIYDGGNNLYIDNIKIFADSKENQASSIVLTSPINDSIYMDIIDLPMIPVQADVSDVDSYISHVVFYMNGEYIGEDDTYPFEVTAQPTSLGQQTFYAEAIDDSGEAAISATHQIQLLPPIDQLLIDLYTNPVLDKILLEIEAPHEMVMDYHVYNTLGQEVGRGIQHLVKGNNLESIDFDNYAAGYYLLYIKGEGVEQTMPFFKEP